MEATRDTAAELAAMAKMPPRELREKYRALFGEESRNGNPRWLFRRCAWRLQALSEGDLSDRARRRARELARDVDLRVLRSMPSKVSPNPLRCRFWPLAGWGRWGDGGKGKSPRRNLPIEGPRFPPGAFLLRAIPGEIYESRNRFVGIPTKLPARRLTCGRGRNQEFQDGVS